MRILQIIQKKQLRGVEIFTAQLSTHLQQNGHQVLIAALQDGKDQLPFKGSIQLLPVNFSMRWFDWKGWKSIALLIKDFQPDLVQANAADTLKYAVLSKIIFRWKQPLLYRNASIMSRYAGSALSKLFIKFLLKNVTRIVSVSNTSKADILANFGISETKIKVIPIGIEDRQPQPLSPEPQPGFHLVHVGGFSFEKNHTGLVSIFKKIHAALPNSFLWLVGDGPLKKQTEEEVKQNGLDSFVHFTGALPNGIDYIAAADVLLLPSIIEGLPAVVLEAFYYHTPVIAYAVGAIPEVVTEKTGWLVPKGDEDGFAETAVKLLQNKMPGVNERTTAANKLVLEQYHNKKVTEQFEKLYREFC